MNRRAIRVRSNEPEEKEETVKYLFYRLLDCQLRMPNFFDNALANFPNITVETAVDSVFCLVDEVVELVEMAEEVEKISQKFIKHIETKDHVGSVINDIRSNMRFVDDGNLSELSIKHMKAALRRYAAKVIKDMREGKSIEQYFEYVL